jgi:hypothetical protein
MTSPPNPGLFHGVVHQIARGQTAFMGSMNPPSHHRAATAAAVPGPGPHRGRLTVAPGGSGWSGAGVSVDGPRLGDGPTSQPGTPRSPAPPTGNGDGTSAEIVPRRERLPPGKGDHVRSLIQDRTPAEPAAPAARWWWGTNHAGGTYYAGRAHVVEPSRPRSGLCGLPVDNVWTQRPPLPEHLCPDCCVLAMTIAYPTLPRTPPSLTPPLAPRNAASTGRLIPPAPPPTEQTTATPTVGPCDAPRNLLINQTPTVILPTAHDLNDGLNGSDSLIDTLANDRTEDVAAGSDGATALAHLPPRALLEKVLAGLRQL